MATFSKRLNGFIINIIHAFTPHLLNACVVVVAIDANEDFVGL